MRKSAKNVFNQQSIPQLNFYNFSLIACCLCQYQPKWRPWCYGNSYVSVAMIIPSRSHKLENGFLRWNTKWNTTWSSSFLMHVNCKKFLCLECGSDYISLSKNKHGAKEKDIGRGESLSMGHPQENLTRSTVCLCKPGKS